MRMLLDIPPRPALQPLPECPVICIAIPITRIRRRFRVLFSTSSSTANRPEPQMVMVAAPARSGTPNGGTATAGTHNSAVPEVHSYLFPDRLRV